MREDPALELDELWSRLQPELLGEAQPPGLEDREGLGVTTGTVERGHQLTDQPFPERVCLNESLQRADHGAAAAQSEVCFHGLLDCKEASLLQQSCLFGCERLEEEVSERLPLPERERLAERRSRLLGVAVREQLPATGQE